MVIESLGSGAIYTNIQGYGQLISFYERCSLNTDEDILVDLTDLTWIDANMSALIMGIMEKLRQENNLEFYVDSDDIQQRFKILVRNGLIGGLEIAQTAKGSEIKLTGFGKADDVSFINYIENELLAHENLLLGSDERYRLEDAFLELFSNVQKHARTDNPIFACGQYYPKRLKLGFTLVDLGIGYLIPINEFTNGIIKTASEAILWALKGNTTKRDAPGGLGLTEISRFCNENKATFEIVTGDSYWSNRFRKPELIKPFCGTIVNVIFDCSK